MGAKNARAKRKCAGKQKHSQESAVAHLIHLRRKGGPRAGGMKTYQCPFCGSWHVGHMPQKIRQSVAAKRRNRREQ